MPKMTAEMKTVHLGRSQRTARVRLLFLPVLTELACRDIVLPEFSADRRRQIAQVFKTRTVDHQHAVRQRDILLLTDHLILEPVQNLP